VRAAEQEEVQQQQQRDDQQDHLNHTEDIFHNMFDDLNALKMTEDLGLGDAEPVRDHDRHSHERGQAELTMYKAEPMLSLQKEDRSVSFCMKQYQQSSAIKQALKLL
jgi:hypothetical protein